MDAGLGPNLSLTVTALEQPSAPETLILLVKRKFKCDPKRGLAASRETPPYILAPHSHFSPFPPRAYSHPDKTIHVEGDSMMLV